MPGPVFNSNDYEVQGGLTEARADLLYCLRVGDNVHEASLTVPHFYAQIVDAPNDSNLDLTIGSNAATIQIGNAAGQTTIKKLKTQGVLKAEDGIETSSVEVTGSSTHTGSVEVTGMLYANAGLSMGSALIDLGASTATRVSGNLGYNLKYTAFAASTNFNGSGANKNFWAQFGNPAYSVWSVNVILQLQVYPVISNVTVTCGNGNASKNFAYVQRPISVTTTTQITINLNTVISLSASNNFYVSGIANYTGTAPNLIGAGSSVSITRIG